MNSKKNIIKLMPSLSVIWISCNFASGSFPYAEEYEINYPKEKVIDAINKFKLENPDFSVPKVKINNKGSWDLIDEPIENPPQCYKFYFYYKNKNEIIYTYVCPIEKDKTKFCFVSVNSGLNIGTWREINKDLSSSKNEEQKVLFEERILNKINILLKGNE